MRCATMENFCYDLAIRQRRCQNSISLTTDNVYTNIEENAQIQLFFGYTLTIISKNNNSVTIELENFDLLQKIKFNIPIDRFKCFDLPMYNGSYILLIGISRNNCPCPNLSR